MLSGIQIHLKSVVLVVLKHVASQWDWLLDGGKAGSSYNWEEIKFCPGQTPTFSMSVLPPLPLIVCTGSSSSKTLGLLPVSTLGSIPGVLGEQALDHNSNIKKLRFKTFKAEASPRLFLERSCSP